jgi:hypothetical protein
LITALGAQDRALVEFYRENVSEAAKRIAGIKEELKWYENKHVAVEVPNVDGGFTSWYRRRVSMTRMPVSLR